MVLLNTNNYRPSKRQSGRRMRFKPSVCRGCRWLFNFTGATNATHIPLYLPF